MSTEAMPKPAPAPGAATLLFRRVHYRFAATPLRSLLLAWRHLGLQSEDIFLGCYPRSGGTWLRFTLREVLTGEPSNFDNVNSAFRGLSDHRQGWRFLPGGGRFIGSHEQYRPEYRKAVYLVRDVRDVALSEFAFEKNLGIRRHGFDQYLQDMLQGKKRYGSWQRHVQSWLDSPVAQSDNFLLLRYEDLRREPVERFTQLVNFLGVSVASGAVERALANNTIERMREKEDRLYREQSYGDVPRRPLKGVDPGGRFVRTGQAGGWQARLTEPQLRLIEQYAGEVMRRLGYPPALTS